MSPWFSPAEMPRNTPTTPPAAEPVPPRYEDALAELEGLVQRMEDGQLPLDQLLDNYRRGAALLELCRSRLAAIEQQVKVLEDGQLKPWVAGA
jgi:exodeoxyribonuclease VII small subunit